MSRGVTRLKVTPLPPLTPPGAEVLDRKLDALLPRVRVTELLREVAADPEPRPVAATLSAAQSNLPKSPFLPSGELYSLSQ